MYGLRERKVAFNFWIMRVWNDYMERIMCAEDDGDNNVSADAVGGTVDSVSKDEVVKAFQEMRAGGIALYLLIHLLS